MSLLYYVYLVLFLFFFFKQKTAYEMRISDWSSDVCSSDLADGIERHRRLAIERAASERAFVQRLVAVGDHRDDAGHGAGIGGLLEHGVNLQLHRHEVRLPFSLCGEGRCLRRPATPWPRMPPPMPARIRAGRHRSLPPAASGGRARSCADRKSVV